jgi:hypothetical protein
MGNGSLEKDCLEAIYLLVLYGIRLIGSTLDIAGLHDADLSLMRHNALLNSI